MSEQIFQIGVKAVIRNSNGELLLLQKKTETYEGWWDFPGGRLDPGEDFEQALVRELAEELSVTEIRSHTLLMVAMSDVMLTTPQGDTALALIIYEVKINDASALLSQETDVRLEWVAPQEASIRLAKKYSPDFCKQFLDETYNRKTA